MVTYLLATDGSDPARNAEEYIENVANPDQDRVIVLAALHSSAILGDYQYTSSSGEEILDYESLLNKISMSLENLVDTTADRLQESGFDAQAKLVNGLPGEQICQSASELDVDVIVMGRRGAGAWAEVLLGSVSSYVVHHADCPVTLVPSEDQS